MSTKRRDRRGFTLIELSIVLVIIGLIVGGVLVGRDLINAAAVRAQISQIEKYQTAVNTFRGKYGYLPGDIPNPDATNLGFNNRGAYPGEGDGNGVIEGVSMNAYNSNLGIFELCGETATFWVDLSTAKLIDGTFTTAAPSTSPSTALTQTQIGLYLPPSKINATGYIYVWSGGWQENMTSVSPGDSQNYFALAASAGTGNGFGNCQIAPIPVLTVAQAYSIDKKMDDGLPQSGNVTAYVPLRSWAAGGSLAGSPPFETNSGDESSSNGGPITSAADIGNGMLEGPNYCYDARSTTAGSGTLPEQYSIEVNNVSGVNCWLSFRFQ